MGDSRFLDLGVESKGALITWLDQHLAQLGELSGPSSSPPWVGPWEEQPVPSRHGEPCLHRCAPWELGVAWSSSLNFPADPPSQPLQSLGCSGGEWLPAEGPEAALARRASGLLLLCRGIVCLLLCLPALQGTAASASCLQRASHRTWGGAAALVLLQSTESTVESFTGQQGREGQVTDSRPESWAPHSQEVTWVQPPGHALLPTVLAPVSESSVVSSAPVTHRPAETRAHTPPHHAPWPANTPTHAVLERLCDISTCRRGWGPRPSSHGILVPTVIPFSPRGPYTPVQQRQASVGRLSLT